MVMRSTSESGIIQRYVERKLNLDKGALNEKEQEFKSLLEVGLFRFD